MEVYAGMLDAMDYQYGRVIDFLKDIGEYENTVVIFLSDNGANPWYSSTYPGANEPDFRKQFDYRLENIGHPGSNHAYGIGFANSSAGPLDKYKFTVAEGGIRVPLLISGPGIQSGVQTDAFAYVWDIMPTILEMAGVEYPATFSGRPVEPMRGRSILGMLDGSATEVYGADEFVSGEMQDGKWVRQGDLKAIFIPEPEGAGEWQLFDVASDPGEAKNLAAQMPEKLEEMQANWDIYADDVGVIPGVPPV